MLGGVAQLAFCAKVMYARERHQASYGRYDCGAL